MLKRILTALVTIFISLILVFVVIEAMPGDPVDLLAQEYARTEGLSYEIAFDRAKATLNYDPDIPVMERFVEYVGGIFTGNLGQSMIYKKSVIDIVLGALPWTLLVLSISLFLSFTVGVGLGIYIAWKRKKYLNVGLNVYQSIFGSIPDYIVGYVLIFIFSVYFGLLSSRGAYTVQPAFSLEFIINILKHAALPVMTYFLTTLAGWTMSMRANSLSVLGEDYMNYARARGLSKKRILSNYLGRNAMLPMVTSVAISFGFMFGGSPLIENLFLYPGVGYYLNMGINRRDFPLMQGMFLIIIVMVIVSGVISEILYTRLNPRLRDSK